MARSSLGYRGFRGGLAKKLFDHRPRLLVALFESPVGEAQPGSRIEGFLVEAGGQSLLLGLRRAGQGVLQRHAGPQGQVDVVDRRPEALPCRLAPQLEFEWQAGQAIVGDGLEIEETRRQGADTVEASGPEDEAAQRIVITDADIEPAQRLARPAFGQWALLGGRTREGLDGVVREAFGLLTVANTLRPAGLAIEEMVGGAEVESRFVEEQADRNTAQLAALPLAELLIQGMGQPAFLALNLRRDGELVVLLRQALAGFLDDLTDGDPPEQGRRDSETFQHEIYLP